MADSNTRKNIFEIFDNYYSGSDEDFQAYDPNEHESSEDAGYKEQEFCIFRF